MAKVRLGLADMTVLTQESNSGDDARSLLLDLKDYRFRDEVREAAAALLNLPN